MQLTFNQIVIPPGQNLLLKGIDWLTLEKLLEELGETRAARISYSRGMLEVMVPLAEHEDGKEIIGDLVKIILEEMNIEFRALGSTTFKNEQMAQAIEADACFYIHHEAMVRGKKRIDLIVDPPPDLAIEIDISSRTHFDNYEKLGVPELWRYDGEHLEINVLQNGRYVTSTTSVHFPQLPLVEAIPQYVKQSQSVGRNVTMKAFRAWVRNPLG
ncbi:MAG: Uma2 family endonuclease [Thioploca sp.]|nr:Uma2 family endonuclease [Thioploca sp.]